MRRRQSIELGFADVIARDRDENPVLLVEVKSPKQRFISDRPDPQLARWARDHADGGFPLLMVANANDTLIYRPEDVPDTGDRLPPDSVDVPVACSFASADLFTRYDPEYREKAESGRILPYYLTGLVIAWLRDFAYHWKSEVPPGADRLREIGLADRLEGGWAEEQDRDDDPLR